MPPRRELAKVELDRSIGQRIRARRKSRGWTQQLVADRAGISKSELSRLENGRVSADNRFILADLAQALECSFADLVGRPMVYADRDAQRAQAQVQPVREALIEIDLSYPASSPVLSLDRLVAELDLVRYLRFRRCDYAGLGERLPAFLRGVHAVAVAGGQDREAALRAMVEACYIAHDYTKDVGYPADCWVAAERSRQAAEALEDPVLMAFAGWVRTLVCTSGGMYSPGVTIAGREVDALHGHLDRPDALVMLGMLQLAAGFSAYGLHRPADGAAWFDDAASVATRTGETTTAHLYFGPTNVGIWRVSASVDGADPTSALRWADRVDPMVIEAPFRQASYFSDTARALAHTGRAAASEQAVSMLLRAEQIAPQWLRMSPTTQETARALRERVRQGSAASALRGLCERMGLAS